MFKFMFGKTVLIFFETQQGSTFKEKKNKQLITGRKVPVLQKLNPLKREFMSQVLVVCDMNTQNLGEF